MAEEFSGTGEGVAALVGFVAQGWLGRRGHGGAGVTLVTLRCCRAPAASPPAQRDPLASFLNDNIADVPSSVQEQKGPCIPITPALGAAQGCRRQHRWVLLLVGSSAPPLGTALLGFGTACLAVCPHTPQPLLELQGQGWRDLKGAAAAPMGSSEPPRLVQEQRVLLQVH